MYLTYQVSHKVNSLLNSCFSYLLHHLHSLFLAKLAEEAKRWEDVVYYMRNISISDRELTPEERNLFSVGYKNLIGAYHVSWRLISAVEQEEGSKGSIANVPVALVKHCRLKLEGKIASICEDVLDILHKHLIPSATSESWESNIFYGQMQFGVDNKHKESITKSLEAYNEASNAASAKLQATHPIRLHLALTFSMFYYEVLERHNEAVHLAQQALDDAHARLDELPRRTTMIQ
ncbi:14-3-3 protein [Imleria badia]|nr:14-3-3 protein [Imleria badia]